MRTKRNALCSRRGRSVLELVSNGDGKYGTIETDANGEDVFTEVEEPVRMARCMEGYNRTYLNEEGNLGQKWRCEKPEDGTTG